MKGLVLASFLSSFAQAARPFVLQAPEFPKGLPWLNAEEFSLERLKGRRVTLVGFISVSSAISLRTMARLQAWWKRYSLDGLMIIGVHTPDFEFEKDPAVVRAELKRLGVEFPVVLDNDRKLWSGYHNEGWPSLYLLDPRGLIVFDRLGEGREQEFEIEIIRALERFNHYSPKGYWPAPDPSQADCGTATPLLYAGAARGHPQARGNERGRLIVSSRDGELAYRGAWKLAPDALRSERASRESDFIRILYHAAASLALARAQGSAPIQVFVKQDDFWLNPRNAGPDVRFDKSRRSFVAVSNARFYGLTRNAAGDMHELMLYPAAAGLEVYAFDFANACHDRSSR